MTEWDFEGLPWFESGEYDGTDCSSCGRSRVMICETPNGQQRRVCEKCRWDHSANNYASSSTGGEHNAE
jgi:hypothetical protein